MNPVGENTEEMPLPSSREQRCRAGHRGNTWCAHICVVEARLRSCGAPGGRRRRRAPPGRGSDSKATSRSPGRGTLSPRTALFNRIG